MMQLLLALATVLGLSGAEAAPRLTGPMIRAVTTDRAIYRAGEQADIRVTLQNGGATSFNGTLSGTMTGRGVPVGPPASVGVAGLAPGASQTVDLLFAIPAVDHHGYHVALQATAGAAVLDTAAAAIDASSDTTYYPRTCWRAQTFPQWGGYTPPAFPSPQDAADTALAWGCNVVLMYGQLYKQHLPFVDAPSWLDPDGATQTAVTVLNSIAANKARRIASYAYVPIYAAIGGAHPTYPPYTQDGSGVSPAWGMFATNCAPGCTIANQKGFPADPASTNVLALLDPTNPDWQSYFVGANRPLLTRFGYDGFFLDTYGAPYPSATVYNAAGGTIDFGTALSGFYNRTMGALGSQGFVNTVSGWGEQDMAAHSSEPFYWSERHPEINDLNNFSLLNYTVDVVQSYTARHLPVVLALYMDYALSQDPTCRHNGGPRACAFNLPGMLTTEAMIGAAGAYHAEIADNDRFLDNEGYPLSNQLDATPALIGAMYDAAVFDRAYEKLTRDGVTEGYPSYTTTITAGGTSSTAAVAGQVYALTKERPGLHVINLVQMPKEGVNPQDPNASYTAPAGLGAITLKSYYPGSVTGSNRLWWASPDVAHGAPQQVAFTKGSDAGGPFVTFTLPSLLYRDMAWLELDALATSDYATP